MRTSGASPYTGSIPVTASENPRDLCRHPRTICAELDADPGWSAGDGGEGADQQGDHQGQQDDDGDHPAAALRSTLAGAPLVGLPVLHA